MTLARFTAPRDERRAPLMLEVVAEDGAWTEGPFVCLAGPVDVELSLGELVWLVEDAGPAALERLRKERGDAAT